MPFTPWETPLLFCGRFRNPLLQLIQHHLRIRLLGIELLLRPVVTQNEVPPAPVHHQQLLHHTVINHAPLRRQDSAMLIAQRPR